MLREAIRPLEEGRTSFCLRLYHVMYLLEANPDVVWLSLSVNENDILVINHHLSESDGLEAVDMLKQARAALYELQSGKEVVYLASEEEMDDMLDAEVGKSRPNSEK